MSVLCVCECVVVCACECVMWMCVSVLCGCV